MTDDRSRRFEQDLSAVLRRAAGDGAPASLRHRLADPLSGGCTAQQCAVNPRCVGQTIASQDCDLRGRWGGD